MLVDDSALNEYSAQGRTGARAGGPVTHTRGLCLTEHHSTIRVASIRRRNIFSLASEVRFDTSSSDAHSIRDSPGFKYHGLAKHWSLYISLTLYYLSAGHILLVTAAVVC